MRSRRLRHGRLRHGRDQHGRDQHGSRRPTSGCARVAREVEAVNARYGPPERIRDFAIAAVPFSVAARELTPTLKIRRDVVARRHAALVETLRPAPRRATCSTGNAAGVL